MRLLTQHTAALQFLAEWPGRPVELNADPQPLSADVDDVRAADTFQVSHGVCAKFGRALRQLFVDNDAERGAGDGARQRVTAEGAAVIAGTEDAQDLSRAEYRRHRVVPAGQRLTEDQYVRRDALVHIGKQLAGAAEPGLNLIEDEQDVVFAADLRDVAEIACWRHDDASFALDGFHQEGTGLGCDRAT